MYYRVAFYMSLLSTNYIAKKIWITYANLSYNHSRVRPDHNLYTNPFTTITTITCSYLLHNSEIFSILKRVDYWAEDDDDNDDF